MDTTVIGTLQELRCSALADYFLGHMAPNMEATKPLDLSSPEDLYAYLLLDSQIGQQPESSALAEAIAAVQQYLNAVYHSMEPGHNQEFGKDELDAWHICNSNIGNWAGFEKLKQNPENYIDPMLRLGKTAPFEELVTNFSQGGVEDRYVQKALHQHLTQFELICNLSLKAGYINSTYTNDPAKGKNFSNADYYLIGQQRVPPFNHYWRKAEVELNESSTFLPPTAWSDWSEIAIPQARILLGIRPVFFANRLMVVVVEGDEREEQTQVVGDVTITIPGGWLYEIKVAYLDGSGSWSMPLSLKKGKMNYRTGELTQLVVTTFVDDEADPQLQLAFAAQDPKEGGTLQIFYAATDKLFTPIEPHFHTLNVLLDSYFSNPMTLQYNFTDHDIAEDTPMIREEASGAQFLDMRILGIPGVPWIRLNSLFGPRLVASAAVSVDELLSLATQNTLEPPPDGSPTPWAPIDFNSAHGLFYWELFFHMVFLIACRLRDEGKYLDSQRWFHYLFNPHIRTPREGEDDPIAKHWLCRPLLEDGTSHFESKNLVDPDAIALADRIHYRKAVFINYVRCILAHADSLYRQLTRDSLAAAKLQYMRALALMGPEPTGKAMDHWVPRSVNEILETKAQTVSSLESYAAALAVNIWDLPPRITGTADYTVLKLDVFRPFANDEVLNFWKYINECLFNMRHNLTIDGKEMSLDLYAPPTDVRQLMLAQAGGSWGALRNAGGWKAIPHYRFRPLLAIAQNAVQMLMNYGREVRLLMEAGDRTEYEELSQVHGAEMSAFAIDIQGEAIKQIQASLKGLEESKRVVEDRAKYYQGLDESRLVAKEIKADDKVLDIKGVQHKIRIAHLVAGVLDAAPNMFGMSSGGWKFSSLTAAAGAVTNLVAEAYALDAESMHKTAFYERRSLEWRFASQQAKSEMLVLDQQILAMQHSLTGATASLAQTRRAHAQAEAVLSFYKTRSTNRELYRHLLGQMSTLFFQAYDTVFAMCMMAESSLQYELGDYRLNVIQGGAWQDRLHGLGSGEILQGYLTRMERIHLERNERRLELTKTISLRRLFERGVFGPETEWPDVIAALIAGKVDFEIPQRLLDEDYPGHYCRQVVMASLSVPAVLGAYVDLKSTLTQLRSVTALEPNPDSLPYLYREEGHELPPPDVVLNLRNNQQIAISSGVDDAGMHQMSMSDDGRYFAFEGTGAVSTWRLEFPRSNTEEQQKIINSMTDVIMHLRYTAKSGGPAYKAAVLEKLEG
ncbi:neuraminidase-like domain-containing protein [Pseudomonas sp. MYb118]|uniref:Tc toxin subunit A-related protein n=1 Tax=Pseudomonas sp. MYb118 TaxID=1848720 RepID=UPI0034CD993E